MRLRLQWGGRRYVPPLLPTLVVITWLALVVGGAACADAAGPLPRLCAFHRFTGQPCPTCGTTRAGLAMLAGHPDHAFALNPLMTASLLLLLPFVLLHYACGLRLRVDTGLRERRLFWIAGISLVLLNWVWLVWMRV